MQINISHDTLGHIMDIEIKKLDNSEVEITGEISVEILERHRKVALKKLSKNVKIDGFRKGHIPEDVLLKEVGEQIILEEMAHKALAEQYPLILEKHKIDAIGQPEATITKLAPGNPLGFKVKVAVMPDHTLPDYKALAAKAFKKVEKIEVTDKEVEDTVSEILKMQTNATAPTKEGEKSEEDEDTDKKEPVTELTDEFVQTLGEFKTVKEFKDKLRENITFEKERKAAEKKRLETMEAIIGKTKMELPEIIVEAEQQKILAQFKADVTRMGATFDDYLKEVKKTEQDILAEIKDDAVKRAKTQIILNSISEKEDITVPEKIIEAEVKRVLEQYKDADEERALIYVTTTMTNAKVFEFLESQK